MIQFGGGRRSGKTLASKALLARCMTALRPGQKIYVMRTDEDPTIITRLPDQIAGDRSEAPTDNPAAATERTAQNRP